MSIHMFIDYKLVFTISIIYMIIHVDPDIDWLQTDILNQHIIIWQSSWSLSHHWHSMGYIDTFRGLQGSPHQSRHYPVHACSVAPFVRAMDKMMKKLSGDYRAFGGKYLPMIALRIVMITTGPLDNLFVTQPRHRPWDRWRKRSNEAGGTVNGNLVLVNPRVHKLMEITIMTIGAFSH